MAAETTNTAGTQPFGERISTPMDDIEKEGKESHTDDRSDVLENQLSRQQSVWLHETFSPAREILFVAVICLGQFLTQAAFSELVFVARVVGDGLGASSAGERSWTIAAFSLTVGTFVLPAGRLGDMWGHKRMLVIGWIWFGICSIVAGLGVFVKKGQAAVIFFSIFQAFRGIGPALLLPNSLAILGRAYPVGRRKDMAFAMFAMSAPTGAIFGSAFAAIFAQLTWWPWVFWSIGIAIMAIAVLAAIVIPADDGSKLAKDQKFDFIGALLGVSGLVLFNFAWNQAGVVGWGDPYVPVLMVVGILLAVAFILYERRVENPLLPPSAFTPRTSITLGVVGLGWASFGVFIYYTITFLQDIRGLTILASVAEASPIAVSGLCAAVLTGFLISRVPPPWMLTIAAAAFAIGNILTATFPAHQVYWAQAFVAFIITPFGMDISFPAASLMLSDLMPKHLQGVAGSLVSTVVNYSISIGLGVAGTAERSIRLDGASKLEAYRAAMYTGVGMGSAAFLLAASFALYSQFLGQEIPVASKEAVEEDI